MDGKYQGLHVLVVGAGSIGMRHLTNLQRMGVGKITVVETDNQQRRAVHSIVEDFNILSSLEDALTMTGINAAMVCVPTYLHADTGPVIIDALKIPVFIEKPISNKKDDALFLCEMAKSSGIWGMVGYSLRYHPPLVMMKELLESKNFGNPLYIRAEVGQWLPDWHPGMDYRHWYMASEEQGGGAVTDLSHEIDYVCWLLNELPISVQAVVRRVSQLEIDTDDLAELILRFDSGTVASIHMDLIQRIFRRRVLIACQNGSIEWDSPGVVSTYKVGADGWTNTNMDVNRNIQFENEITNFLDAVLKEKSEPRPNFADGVKVLDIIQAAKESSRTGKEIGVLT